MSNKDLQRVTESLSYIGQALARCHPLPARSDHITQKIKIAGQPTPYLSVHDDAHPAEISLRVKNPSHLGRGVSGYGNAIAP